MTVAQPSGAPLFLKEDFTVFADGLDHPEGLAFDLYVANLGRWHIGRVHVGVSGQRLANL